MNKSKAYRRVLLLALGFFLSVSLILGFNLYFTQIKIYQDKELSKLAGIVNTLAPQIDGDQHQYLVDKYAMDGISMNDEDSIYYQIHQQLERATSSNELNSTLYTMIYSQAMEKFCFGVASSARPFWKHPYRDYPAELLSKYEVGGVIEPYQDSNGTWLSAFAPVKNAQGEVVAVLQADERFDKFIMEAKNAVWKNILVMMLIVGALTGLMLYIVRRLVKQQSKLDEQKEEIVKFRKELIANVSHDLRTPLASIQGYLETVLLKRDRLDDERINKYLQTSLRNTAQLNNLIEELFELSKLESKERKLNLESLVLPELAHDIVNSHRIIAAEKEVELQLDVTGSVQAVKADIALIDRVIVNLLSNAIKFSPQGGLVSIRIQQENKKVNVIVEDQGSGIAEEDLKNVFDRFHKSTVGNKQGSGLGLAIVKNILDLHGSSYNIESELGKGTSFYFTLDCY
ncbi:MAG: HAMP domain-containing histidine kinase [Flavobacteriales bacterium]|nr:HAMP domain-containing histidine kinase [Flavobacteriales bacterium]